MAKKSKTSQNLIKETRKGLQKVQPKNDLLHDEFRIEYDREYPKNHIMKGDVKVYAESLEKNPQTGQFKVVEELIKSVNRVITSNVKREIARANYLFRPLLRGSQSPGRIVISDCKVACKADLMPIYLLD